MPIFEFQCNDCFSVFECLYSVKNKAKCVFCEGNNLERVRKSLFSPNKGFCKKNNKFLIKKKDVRSSLIDLFGKNDLKCYIKCNNKF